MAYQLRFGPGRLVWRGVLAVLRLAKNSNLQGHVVIGHLRGQADPVKKGHTCVPDAAKLMVTAVSVLSRRYFLV